MSLFVLLGEDKMGQKKQNKKAEKWAKIREVLK